MIEFIEIDSIEYIDKEEIVNDLTISNNHIHNPNYNYNYQNVQLLFLQNFYRESTNRINAACPSSVRLYTPAHSSTFTKTLLISSCRISVIFSAVIS